MPQLFENAFTHAAIGMALVGLDGRWLRVNRSLCQLLGYPESELLALSFQDLTHPDDLAADLAYVGQILRGEIDTYQMEKRYLRRDDHLVWGLLSVSLVRSPADGAPLHFISQVQDITALKEAEARARAEAREKQRLYDDLHTATEEIRALQDGLITICAWTKKVRREGNWVPLENFLSQTLHLKLSHGMSDEAAGRMIQEQRPTDTP